MTSRVEIDGDSEDTLFRIFDDTQGLQRRAFRLLARGFFNVHGIEEMQRQAEGVLREIEILKTAARTPPEGA